MPLTGHKPHLEIVFDRKDKIYTAGEMVRGQVVVETQSEFTFDALVLKRFWETHGRGNKDIGGRKKSVLARGSWQAGKQYRYRFSFWAPQGPPTYHGQYLHIDHYVTARAKVPWASDPKVRSRFLVEPRPDDPPTSVERLVNPKKINASGCAPLVMATLVVFAVLFGLTLEGVFGPLLVVAAAGVGLYYGVRKAMLLAAYGHVHLKAPHGAVAPGQRMPVRLRFVPSRSYTITSVQARLTGKEVVHAGSGKDRRTHTHTFFDETFRLSGETEVAQDKRVEIEGTIRIPDAAPPSFRASANNVVWTVEVCIDVPNWPDWTEQWDLDVQPPSRTPEPEPDEEAPIDALAALIPPGPEVQVDPEPEVEAPVEEEVAEVPPPDQDVSDGPEGKGLPPRPPAPVSPDRGPPAPHRDDTARVCAAMREAAEADRYSGERAALLESLARTLFEFEVTVARVCMTTAYDAPADYRRGKTVEGTLADGETAVAVRFEAAVNDAVERLVPGQGIRVSAALVEIDDVFHRGVFEGDLLDS